MRVVQGLMCPYSCMAGNVIIDSAMQKYENMSKETSFSKRLISEFLGFLKNKVDNGTLTLEEEMAIINVIERDIPLSATSEDLARYYRQSPGNIRAVIHRRMPSKPRRRVMYSFLDFAKIIPEKWLR